MNRRHSQAGVTLMELLVAISLLSLLSVGMLFAMRVGLSAMGRTNNRVIDNRRALGVERILTKQIAGFVPSQGLCAANPQGQGAPFPFFQGDPQTMRFVSTYSLQEASRGYPQILEFQVIPGENGVGVRLIVNETLYTGPLGNGAHCLGITPGPAGVPKIIWRPVAAAPASFILADKLARCSFAFKEQRDLPQPDLWHVSWPHDYTPAAVRIDLAPIEPNPARIQVPPVVAPFRVTRHAFTEYGDW